MSSVLVVPRRINETEPFLGPALTGLSRPVHVKSHVPTKYSMPCFCCGCGGTGRPRPGPDATVPPGGGVCTVPAGGGCCCCCAPAIAPEMHTNAATIADRFTPSSSSVLP